MLTETEIQNSIAGHAKRNAMLLENLKRKGVRLDDRHSVEHHFYAKDQQSAALLASELYGRGYLVLVICPSDMKEGPKLWNIEVGINRTINQAADPALTEELVRLAARFDATYDGWGTSV